MACESTASTTASPSAPSATTPTTCRNLTTRIVRKAFLLWCADHLLKDGVLAYNHKPRRRDYRLILPAAWFLRPAVAERLTLVEEIIWDRGSTHNHEVSMF